MGGVAQYNDRMWEAAGEYNAPLGRATNLSIDE